MYLNLDGTASLDANEADNGTTDNTSATHDLTFEFEGIGLSENFDCDDLGTIDRNVLVTDEAGNTSNPQVMVITVVDDMTPVAVAHDTTVAIFPGEEAVISAADLDNGGFDNCGIESLTLDRTTFTLDDLGENTVTLTAIDASGNSHQANATVTVTLDSNIPSINDQVFEINEHQPCNLGCWFGVVIDPFCRITFGDHFVLRISRTKALNHRFNFFISLLSLE